jgi:glutamate-1-semialdehyde 2,1-aminomutase
MTAGKSISKVAMKRIENFEKSRALASRARDLIPGGAHTYSKGSDQFPFNSPGFIERAEGCRVIDVDGNEYIDWGMGLRSVVLGYSYPSVIEAVQNEIAKGPNFLLPAPVEVELAELLTRLIPSAEMVKFAKNGSNVTTAAIRLARAFTGRPYIALCKEHPFYSFDDWFIGTTPPNSGIPEESYKHSLIFHYNDLPSLEALFREYPDQIAAVIMEPVTLEEPKDNFLQKVRELSQSNGALLIFDEMISGFRWHLQGAQAYFNVIPDMSTFGKAIGNGFSVSVLAGRRDVMELGGIYHDKPRVFLLSTTHGAETHSLAACIATIQEIEEQDVIGHIWKIGKAFQDGFNDLAREMGLADFISCTGYPCNGAIITKGRDGQVSMPLRTLFMQEMTAHGVLIPSVVVSFAHQQAEVEKTLAAAREAFDVYGRALDEGTDKYLIGPAVKPVFRRYN